MSSLLLLCKAAVVHSSSRREILRWYRSMQQVWIQSRLLGTLVIIGGGSFIALYLNAPGQGNWAYVGALIVVAWCLPACRRYPFWHRRGA